MSSERQSVELRIFKVEDRVTVAGILFKNGYRVQQVKKKRPSGKGVEYVIHADYGDDAVRT